MIDHKNTIRIQNRKLTHVENFLEVTKDYDFNWLSKLMDEKQLYSNCFNKPLLQPSLSDTWQVLAVSKHDELFTIFHDFVFKLGNYTFNEKDRMDLFISFETSVGPSHTEKEDVFILGLFGKTLYRVWKDDIATEVIINKGDMIYIPSGVLHKSISITPRIITSLGLWGKSND
tara:strand:- start:3449 stop:3967 length:519 start_codon:yes stop_codon:yes gene_type:complete